jgi:hypothetical protein
LNFDAKCFKCPKCCNAGGAMSTATRRKPRDNGQPGLVALEAASVTIKTLRECLREDEGRLFWLARPREHFARRREWLRWNGRYAGQEAGCPDPEGYWYVKVGRKRFRRCVLVWALYHGARPASTIDHKDRDRTNDRLDNLRLATKSQNGCNRSMHKNNTSGFKGVSFFRQQQRWAAQIQVSGRNRLLGFYATPGEAAAAYKAASLELHGDFSTAGTP